MRLSREALRSSRCSRRRWPVARTTCPSATPRTRRGDVLRVQAGGEGYRDVLEFVCEGQVWPAR